MEKIIKKVKTAYSSSKWIQAIVDKVASFKVYRYILKKFINDQSKKDLSGPINLIIETTSICNAKCVMCPHVNMKRIKKPMSEEVFASIISRLKKENPLINKVFMSGFGEPLTDPKFLDRAKQIKLLGHLVKFYTNASLLTSKISKQIIDLKIDEINISFNGTSPKEYKKIMGLDYRRTISNINNLIKEKIDKDSKYPKIQISSIVVKENEKAVGRHLRYWSSKVDSVTISKSHQWGRESPVDNKVCLSRSAQTYPCRSLWHTIVIDCQGNYVLCCRDYESRYVLGNIKNQSFSDIRNSPLLKKFKNKHLEYNKDNLPDICKWCNFPYQGGAEWFVSRNFD